MSGSRRWFLVPSVISFSLAGLSLAGQACSDGPAPPAVTVVDSAGISIVTSNGEGWSPSDAWRLEVDLEVGDLDGPDAFGRLADVAPRRAGGLWVLDGQTRRARAYDETGREVLAFGRPGAGPGELRSASRLGEGSDGSIAVGGRMPPELYRFAADGEPLGVDAVPVELYREPPEAGAPARPPLGPTMGEWAFAADGSAFLQAVTMDAPVEDIVRSDVVLRVADGGRPAVRFARWESPMMTGGPTGRPHLLQPTASWSPLSDGGLWLTRGDAYEVRRHGADGSLLTILRRPGSRTAFTGDVMAAFRDSLAAEADNPGMVAMLENAVFPDSLPATAGLWAAEPAGHVWVGVIDPDLPLRIEEPNAWDVFAPDGAYLGRLPIPIGLRPTRITSGHVYGIWQDELDVDRARRYRIVRNE